MSGMTVLALALVLGSCGDVEPSDRAVTVEVSGCGDAFETSAAGIVVAPERVVTVAHAVSQGDAVSVSWSQAEFAAHVVGYDARTDLAVVAVPGLNMTPVPLAAAHPTASVSVVGGLASGTLTATVTEVLTIRIQEVLGTERVSRKGLELAVSAAVGDSGAGVFDEEGRLVGVLFAVNDDGSSVGWATAATEVEALMSRDPEEWRCDPSRSRLIAQG